MTTNTRSRSSLIVDFFNNVIQIIIDESHGDVILGIVVFESFLICCFYYNVLLCNSNCNCNIVKPRQIGI